MRVRRWLCVLLPLLLLALPLPALADPAGPVTWNGPVTVIAPNWTGCGYTGTAGAYYPRMLKLSNGNWLITYNLYPNGVSAYSCDPSNGGYRQEVAQSTDSGRTWTVLADVADPGRDLSNGQLLLLSNGNILMVARSQYDNGSSHSYYLKVYKSTDGGHTWSYLSTIDSSSWSGSPSQGLYEPFLFLLPNGNLSVLYANEKYAASTPAYSQVISQRISTDSGATWGSESWAVAQSGGGSQRPGMPIITKLASGQLLLVYEICGPDNCDIYSKFSDDGTTWAGDLGSRVGGSQRCAPYVQTFSDGRVFLTSCSNEISYSQDNGATWMMGRPSPWNTGFDFTWPSLYQTGTSELAAAANIARSGGGPQIQINFGSVSAPTVWSNSFSYTFSSGNDSGWAEYAGNYGFSGGNYLLNNYTNNTSGKSLIGDNTWADGDLQADVMLTSSSGNAGLVFRATNPGYFGNGCNTCYAGYDDDLGYYVSLDPSGSLTLGRQANSWTQLASYAMTVTTNTWYHMKVHLRGSSIQVYVTDMTTPKITYTDTTYLRGQIGVRAHFADAQFNNVSFNTAGSAVHHTFSGGAAGWTTYGGSWSTSGNDYVVQATNAEKSLNNGIDNPNFVMEGTITLSNAGQGALLFDVTNPSVGADAFNGYGAGVDSSGSIWLGRWNQAWTQLGRYTTTISVGTAYRVKVTRNGSTIKVYLNDSLVITATDATWTSGQIGVRGGFNDTVHFSNISVGALVADEDFSSGSSNWTPYGGTWSVVSGAYNVSATNLDKSVHNGSGYGSNVLEADVQLANAGQGSLLFNVTDPSTGADAFYGYGAGIDSRGTVWAGRWTYKWNQLASYSTTISTGTWYHLRIVLSGSTITVYLNGTQVLSATDAEYTKWLNGMIGLRGGSNNSVNFKNVLLYAN